MIATISSRYSLLIVAIFAWISLPPLPSSYSKEPVVSRADSDDDLRRLVESLASRNHAPEIVFSATNDEVPVFGKRFDLHEEVRVAHVFDKIAASKTDAMWWQLVKFRNDDRYAITAWNDAFVEMTAENFSVGALCRQIASAHLGEPYLRHLDIIDEAGVPGFEPQDIFWRHKSRWTGKPLYEIQIAVCEQAIKEMNSASDVRKIWELKNYRPIKADEKARFANDVRKEIEKLKTRKKAILPKETNLPGIEMTPFDKKDVQRGNDILNRYGQLK
jgi:hypothetical protein